MRAYSYASVPETSLRRHERILYRVLVRRRTQKRWRFFTRCLKVTFDIATYWLAGTELVREVSPYHRVQRRHDFETVSEYPKRLI